MINLRVLSVIKAGYHRSHLTCLLFLSDVSHFQKLKEETSFDFDIHWNSEPNAIGMMYLMF